MKREDVIKGLGLVLEFLEAWGAGPGAQMPAIVRAAIALLTPPTTEEIGAAQAWLMAVCGSLGPIPNHPTSMLLRALEALAREARLEHENRVACEALETAHEGFGRERAALSAKLARVREVIERHRGGRVWAQEVAAVLRDIDFALADEATPQVTEGAGS